VTLWSPKVRDYQLGTRCRVVWTNTLPHLLLVSCTACVCDSSSHNTMTTQTNTRSPSIAAVSHALSCQPQQPCKQINHNHRNCIALSAEIHFFKQMISYKCLKLISLKLTVRATFAALKLQILPYFARTHDKLEVNAQKQNSSLLQFKCMVVG